MTWVRKKYIAYLNIQYHGHWFSPPISSWMFVNGQVCTVGMTHAECRGNTYCGLPSFISLCACRLNSKGRITREHLGDFSRRWTRLTRNWSLQGQRGKGATRFATGCFIDFFSTGPRYFLRPYLNLHVLVRADCITFMWKVSVTRPTIIWQFSWPLPPMLYSRARVHFFVEFDRLDNISW